MHSPINIQTILNSAARLICLGWTGRDCVAREAHIAELGAHGVPAPSKTPISLELSPCLLTSDHEVGVVSGSTSGEIEFVLVSFEAELLITVGSDQTDREIERISMPVSKQACPKCVASEAWRFADVAGHCDRLILRSWVYSGGRKILYQEGELAIILPAELLLKSLPVLSGSKAAFLFSGTIPTLGGIIYGERYELELFDPVLGRTISHNYNVCVMPQSL